MAGPAFLLHGMIEATISEAIFSVPPASRDAFQQPFHKVLLMATRAHTHTLLTLHLHLHLQEYN